MGRTTQKIYDNKNIFPIICSLSAHEKNSYEISKEMDKAQSTIYEHMQNLLSAKYIIQKDKKRKTYVLNYEKILGDLFDYIFIKIENRIIYLRGEYNEEEFTRILKEDYDLIKDNTFRKSFSTNFYLIEIIKYSLIVQTQPNALDWLDDEMQVSIPITSLKDIFNEVIDFFKMEDLHKDYLTNNLKLRSDKDFRQLIELSFILQKYIYIRNYYKEAFLGAIDTKLGGKK